MKKPSLYLSGPISGLNWEESTGWRDYVKDNLPEFDCFSPLRGKSYLKKLHVIEGAPYYLGGLAAAMSSEQGIMVRDSWDTLRCDGTFVNLLGTKRISIGTVMEIAWAWRDGKPIILVMEKDNPHYHPMITAATPFIVDTLDAGIELTRIMFLP